MALLYNLARMTTATTGTGAITLGSAVSGYLTFALAGVANADVVDYAIKDGANSESGTGTYTSSGTTLTRTVTKSTNSNAAISLSGSAEVFISPRAETLNDASIITTGTMATARLGSGTASATTFHRGDQTWSVPVGAMVAKAWVSFTGSTGAVTSSFNVSSVTRNGAGDYTVNFTSAMSSANYAVIATASNTGSAFSLSVGVGVNAPTTTAVRIQNPTSAVDTATAFVVCFGA